MAKKKKLDLEEIKKKVEQDKDLTDEESLLYLTEVVGYSRLEALRIITIARNKDPNLIID